MPRLLSVFLIVLSAVTIAGHARAGVPEAQPTCAGYPVRSLSDLVAAPRGAPSAKVSVNTQGAGALIIGSPDGGSALYIDCGNGQYYRAVRSAQRLEVRPITKDGWASIFVAWEEDRSTRIDGQLYRFDQLPFASDAPTDFLIEHIESAYSLPFQWCTALKLHAPLYRLTPKPRTDGVLAVGALELELRQQKYLIEADRQDEFSFGNVKFIDLNSDDIADMILTYEERLGSGREGFGALLLNCGDGSYALSGLVSLGPGGKTSSSPATQPRKVCGRDFTTLSFQRTDRLDPAHVEVKPGTHYDLYVYSPSTKRFVFGGSSPRPFTADVVPPSQCADLLRRVDVLAPTTN